MGKMGNEENIFFFFLQFLAFFNKEPKNKYILLRTLYVLFHVVDVMKIY